MFGVSMWEIMLVLLVLFALVGPGKLPDLAKTVGKALGSFRKSVDEVKKEVNLEEELGFLKEVRDVSVYDVLNEPDPTSPSPEMPTGPAVKEPVKSGRKKVAGGRKGLGRLLFGDGQDEAKKAPQEAGPDTANSPAAAGMTVGGRAEDGRRLGGRIPKGEWAAVGEDEGDGGDEGGAGPEEDTGTEGASMPEDDGADRPVAEVPVEVDGTEGAGEGSRDAGKQTAQASSSDPDGEPEPYDVIETEDEPDPYDEYDEPDRDAEMNPAAEFGGDEGADEDGTAREEETADEEGSPDEEETADEEESPDEESDVGNFAGPVGLSETRARGEVQRGLPLAAGDLRNSTASGGPGSLGSGQQRRRVKPGKSA